jgi:hypothetical protein
MAVVAATTVSLACGTNYAYSAWAPQFAEKLLLTATESNLIVSTSASLNFTDCLPGNFGQFWNVCHGHSLWTAVR